MKNRSEVTQARPADDVAAALVDRETARHSDWRAKTLDRLRRLIVAADLGIVEERKWMRPTNPAGVPVWSHAGMVCTGETYEATVKLTSRRALHWPIRPDSSMRASMAACAARSTFVKARKPMRRRCGL